MSDWLAILAAASTVLGATAAPANGPARFALWLAGTVVLSAWLAAAVETVIPSDQRALYRPLLVVVTSSVVTWTLGRGIAATDLRLVPYVVLLAAGASALSLVHAQSIASLLGLSLLAGTFSAIFIAAGAMRRAYDLPRQLLRICVLLVALSALSTIA